MEKAKLLVLPACAWHADRCFFRQSQLTLTTPRGRGFLFLIKQALIELHLHGAGHLFLIKQALIELHLHGAGQAGRYAQFAGAAFLPVKNDLHLGSFDMQGASRANGGTGPALEAFVFIPFYILPNALHLNPEALEITNSSLEILAVPAQLEHHKALLSRVNGSFEDVEGEVKLLDKIDGYGLIYASFWKSQGEYF